MSAVLAVLMIAAWVCLVIGGFFLGYGCGTRDGKSHRTFAADARREALEQAADAARGIGDHQDRGHGEGYMDGRYDAEAAVRSLITPSKERE